MRLLQAAPTDHGIKAGAIDRLVLVRPRLTAASVTVLLAKPAKAPPSVDIFYDSAMALQKRDAMVRHAYPGGTSTILSTASVAGSLYASLLGDARRVPGLYPTIRQQPQPLIHVIIPEMPREAASVHARH